MPDREFRQFQRRKGLRPRLHIDRRVRIGWQFLPIETGLERIGPVYVIVKVCLILRDRTADKSTVNPDSTPLFNRLSHQV